MTQIAVVKDKKIYNLKEIKIKKYIYFVSFYIITAVLLFSGIAKIINPLPQKNTLKPISILMDYKGLGGKQTVLQGETISLKNCV